MSIGKLIGRGRVAEVYAWGDREVVKLFHDGYSAEAVEREAEISRAVHALGLPTPAVGEVVTINNRLGIVFERLDGPSMLAEMSARPWKILAFARLLAELQFAIGNRLISGLPSQRLHLRQSIMSASSLPAEIDHDVLRPRDIGERHPCTGGAGRREAVAKRAHRSGLFAYPPRDRDSVQPCARSKGIRAESTTHIGSQCSVRMTIIGEVRP